MQSSDERLQQVSIPLPPIANTNTALSPQAQAGGGPRTTLCYSTNPLMMVINNKLTAAVTAVREGKDPVALRPHSGRQPVPPIASKADADRPVTAPQKSQRFNDHRIATLLASPPPPHPPQKLPMLVHEGDSNKYMVEKEVQTALSEADIVCKDDGPATPSPPPPPHSSSNRPSKIQLPSTGCNPPHFMGAPTTGSSDALDDVSPADMLSTPTAKDYLEKLLLRRNFDDDVVTTPLIALHHTQVPSTARNHGDHSAAAGMSTVSSSSGSGVLNRAALNIEVTHGDGTVEMIFDENGSITQSSHTGGAGGTNSLMASNLAMARSPREDMSGPLLEFIPIFSKAHSELTNVVQRTMSMARGLKQLVFPPEINTGIPFIDIDAPQESDGGAVNDRVSLSFHMKTDAHLTHTGLRSAAAASTVCMDRGTPEIQMGPYANCSVHIDGAPFDLDQDDVPFSAVLTQNSIVLTKDKELLNVSAIPSGAATPRASSANPQSSGGGTAGSGAPTISTTIMKLRRAAQRQVMALDGIIDLRFVPPNQLHLKVVDHPSHSTLIRNRFHHVDANGSPLGVPRAHDVIVTTPRAADFIAGMSCMSIQRSRNLKDPTRKSLTIVHFNDVYNLIQREGPEAPVVGGAARFHTKLMEIRRKDNPLVLFSGDFMGPSLMSVDMKGKQMVDFFNQCGVHYGCFGNHEFDYGLKALHEVIQGFTLGAHVFTGSTTKWISSNLFEANGQPVCGASVKELFVWNDVAVGLVGLCEDWLGGCSQLLPGEIHYVDMFACGEALAQQLRAEGAEIVIALTHCRLPNDKEIMRRCPNIDLLLGGHDHFYKCIPGFRIVKSGEEFQYLSEIRIELEGTVPGGSSTTDQYNRKTSLTSVAELQSMSSSRGDRTSPTSTSPEDVAHGPLSFPTLPQVNINVIAHPIHWEIKESQQMQKMVTRYQAKLDERMGGVVGRTPVPLDPRESCVRFREGLLTGFVCDVIVQEMRSKVMNVDFAVIGGAAFSGKAIIPTGQLTMGHIFDLFPNDTRVMCMRMPGKTLRRMLTVMVRECPQEAPSFPHCSADLSFTISLIGGLPAKIKDVKIRGEPIDDDKQYIVGVEDFAGKGNGKYRFLKTEAELLVEEESAAQVVFWLIDYFNTKKGQSHNTDKALEQEAVRQQLEKQTKKRKTRQRRGDSGQNSSAGEATPRFLLPLKQFKPVEFASTLESATLARLYAATNLLTEDVESGSNVALIQRVVQRLLKCHACRVYLYDKESNFLRCLVGNQQVSHAMTPQIPATRSSLAGYAIALRCVINTKSAARDECFNAAVDGSPILKISNMLTFPILYRKMCLGVVQAINKETPVSVSIDDEPADWEDSQDAFASSSSDMSESSNSSSNSGDHSDHSPSSPTRIVVQGEDGSSPRSANHRSNSNKRKKREMMFSFTDEDQGLALLLSKQIGMQLHFSNMFEKIQQSELATKNLMEMARLLGRAQKDDSVQQMVLRITEVGKQLIGCDRCSLFLVDKGEMWTVVKTKDMSDNITIRLPRGTGIAGHTAQTGKLMNIHDAYQSPLFNPETDRKTGYYTRTILAVPMLSENQESILGVLQMINKKDGKVFTAADEELATNFVNLAAIAVHNSFEIETLRVGRDESTMQVLPVHELTRITIKGGWFTVRRNLKDIIANARKERLAMGISLPVNREATYDASAGSVSMLTVTKSSNIDNIAEIVGPNGRSQASSRANCLRQSIKPGTTAGSPSGAQSTPHGPKQIGNTITQAMMDFDDLRSDDEHDAS